MQAQMASVSDTRQHCRAITSAGRRCRNHAVDERGFCRVHLPRTSGVPITSERRLPEAILEERLRRLFGFLRRRMLGSYQVDAFGFDKELTEEVFQPLAALLFHRYWRVTSLGMENVPASGGALLVANHSGTLPWDALMMKFGVLENHPARRHVRLLAGDLAFSLPFISHLTRKAGNVVAAHDDALRLLTAGELVGVFPEGYKGLGKPFRDRYRLQRFGRGGFMELALKAQVPVMPVAIVGAEEIYPMIANLKPLARLLGLPYFPITPFFPLLGSLGALPLPSKWIIEFGDPISMDRFGPGAHDDPMLVFELTDSVRDKIQQMLKRNVSARRGIFG
jgi:1-acyl-sn-glycerol-3-phosphate acyltransferase